MKALLATHIARFDSSYSPQASTRIMRYLRTRAKDFKVEFPTFAKPKGKGKVKGKSSPPSQPKRTYGSTQRSWRASEQYIQVSSTCTNQHCIDMNTAHTHNIDSCRNKFSRLGSFDKGKGGHKGKGKGKDGKSRGKGFKGMPKGKGQRKGFKGGSVAPKPRALQSCSYQHRLKGRPLPRPKAQLTSPVTSVTRRVTTSLNAPNGWHFDHPQRTSKRDSRFLD